MRLTRYYRYFHRWTSNMLAYFSSLPKSNYLIKQLDFNKCQKPVLILYGFGATRRSLQVLEKRLKTDGFDPFTLKLGGFINLFNTQQIDILAKYVCDRIESIHQRFQIPKIAIVGHSKGGLIGRYYITQLGGDKRVSTLITLATPHRGTHFGLFGIFAKSLRQMHPKSKLMRTLKATPLPLHVYVVSLFSPSDRVSPSKRCFLEDAKVINQEINGLNHTDFIIKNQAYTQIKKHLEIGFSRAMKDRDKISGDQKNDGNIIDPE